MRFSTKVFDAGASTGRILRAKYARKWKTWQIRALLTGYIVDQCVDMRVTCVVLREPLDWEDECSDWITNQLETWRILHNLSWEKNPVFEIRTLHSTSLTTYPLWNLITTIRSSDIKIWSAKFGLPRIFILGAYAYMYRRLSWYGVQSSDLSSVKNNSCDLMQNASCTPLFLPRLQVNFNSETNYG
jgi:hypothetical protein